MQLNTHIIVVYSCFLTELAMKIKVISMEEASAGLISGQNQKLDGGHCAGLI